MAAAVRDSPTLPPLPLPPSHRKGIAARIGTRDARAVMSHAQKAFVKLANAGKRLPPAVAATGAGYTLSGKALDPTSGSARAYGLKIETVRAHLASGAVLPGLLPLPPPAGENGVLVPANALPPKAAKTASAAIAATAAPEPAAASSPPPLPPPRTDYAKARPQRAPPLHTALGATSESLELLACRPFVGAPGSGAPGAQPFSVTLAPAAAAVMDAHAHLHSQEVIGLLGGSWCAGRREMSITAAHPCRRAPGSSRTSVELDPASEVAARAAMADAGARAVGWFHSHPNFAAAPSAKDAANQRNYQRLFRDDGVEPWVAAIVGERRGERGWESASRARRRRRAPPPSRDRPVRRLPADARVRAHLVCRRPGGRRRAGAARAARRRRGRAGRRGRRRRARRVGRGRRGGRGRGGRGQPPLVVAPLFCSNPRRRAGRAGADQGGEAARKRRPPPSAGGRAGGAAGCRARGGGRATGGAGRADCDAEAAARGEGVEAARRRPLPRTARGCGLPSPGRPGAHARRRQTPLSSRNPAATSSLTAPTR